MPKPTFASILFFFAVWLQAHAQTHKSTVWLQNAATTSVLTTAMGATTTTGDLILVHLSYDSQTKSVTAISDTKGNTYTRIHGPTNWSGTTYRSELWYSYNVTGGSGTNTVTAKLSAATSFFQFYVSEYGGILSTSDPLDQSYANTGSSSPATSSTRTLTYSNELLYGVAIGASGALTAGSAFTQRSNANQNIVEDRSTTTAGAYSATFTSAGGNWVVDMASFRTPSSVLPIRLLSFDASASSEHAVELNWITASEQQNAYFTVERSANGQDYEELAQIQGAGTSSKMHYYSYTDSTPLEEIAYYRLKQTDVNEDFTYSSVCSIDPSAQRQVELRCYPNPAGDALVVFAPEAQLRSVELVDETGRSLKIRISRFSSGDNTRLVVDLSSLAPGTYYLKTNTQTQPIVKQ